MQTIDMTTEFMFNTIYKDCAVSEIESIKANQETSRSNRDQGEKEEVDKVAIPKAVLDVLKKMRGLNTPAPQQNGISVHSAYGNTK